MKNEEMIEGVHFYFNEDGFIVLTDKYLAQRGYCCGMSCLHCPFDYQEVPEPRRTELLKQRKQEKGKS